MPLSDETFTVELVNIVEVEADPENGIKNHARIEFGNGSTDSTWETAATVKRFPIAPATAIAVGEAMAESGRRLLAKPDLSVATDMADAEAEAEALAKLRT
jgi:hypothetical protein